MPRKLFSVRDPSSGARCLERFARAFFIRFDCLLFYAPRRNAPSPAWIEPEGSVLPLWGYPRET